MHVLALALLLGTLSPDDDAAPSTSSEGTTAAMTERVEEAPAPPTRGRRALRVVVNEPVVDDVPERVGQLFANALVTELRKLDGLAVTSMEEVRAMMALEASRELAGCSDTDCLSDIADALGSDELIAVRLGRIGREHQLSIRAVSSTGAAARAVTRRVEARDGEEFFAILADVVDELYPDHEPRPGVKRGVDREVARRLSPPPLSPWMFWTSTIVASAGVVTGLAAGSAMALLVDANQRQLDQSVDVEVQGGALMLNQRRAELLAVVANVGYGVGAASGLASVGTFFFTDFEGLADAE